MTYFSKATADNQVDRIAILEGQVTVLQETLASVCKAIEHLQPVDQTPELTVVPIKTKAKEKHLPPTPEELESIQGIPEKEMNVAQLEIALASKTHPVKALNTAVLLYRIHPILKNTKSLSEEQYNTFKGIIEANEDDGHVTKACCTRIKNLHRDRKPLTGIGGFPNLVLTGNATAKKNRAIKAEKKKELAGKVALIIKAEEAESDGSYFL